MMQDSNSTITSLVGSLFRSGLMITGTLGIYHGATINDGQAQVIAGLVVDFVTVAWSLYQKLQAAWTSRKLQVAAAVESARATHLAGTPVPMTVTVTPDGQANIATRVTAAEAAAAPKV